MMAEVFDKQNNKVGTVDLPEKVFKVKWNPDLVNQVLKAQLANSRRPWAHAKDRSEVRGGGRKPWRQKGTGRARHGSIRSPLWAGGGKAHGPTKDRDYSQKINKKMKRLALMSLLSKKFSDGDIKFFRDLSVEAPKTKILSQTLRPLLNIPKNKKKFDLLLIPDAENKSLERPAANLQKTMVLNPLSLNVYDLMNHKSVFIEEKAVSQIENHYK